MRGHLYVLTNPHMPGLVKIGCTDRTAYQRADELSRATGVPGRYRVERSWLLDNAAAAERRVHGALAAYRLPGSEHFRLPLVTAVEQVEALLRDAQPELRLLPAWRVAASRAAAVALLIVGYWPTLRRLYRQARAALRA
jgi:hypothetical protein